MQKIWDAISAVYDFITGFPQFIIDVVKKLITSFFTMLKDLFIWILKQLFDLVISVLNAFDLSSVQNAIAGYGTLPADIVNILGLCGVGDALAIIVGAIIIRFLLQLIPFVRLGS